VRRLLPAALLCIAASATAAPAARRLDSTLERASAWTPAPGDRVSASVDAGTGRGGSPALLLEWAKDLGQVIDGVPSAPQVPSIWVELPRDVDLSQFTRLRFRARIGGPRHGFLHVAVSTAPALWGNDVKAFMGNVPLDAGAWQQGELSLDLAPEDDRRKMRWLGFASVNVGHLSDEPAVLRTWIDEIVLSADPPPKRRGWDIDPDRIAVSRLGFRPFHEKLALVDGAKAGKRFEVRIADSATVVHAGTLELVESALGRHAVADFSDLTTAGRYRVHAAGLSSLPFRIGADANEPSLTLLADWVHGMRCGQATALHPACHLDDGLWLRPTEQTRGPQRRLLPVAGGWHDAGDVRTYYSYSFEMPYRMLRARDAGWMRDRDGDGVDDMTDSARWALGHATRLVDPVTGGLLDKIDDHTDYRRGNYWSDNLRGSDDDRPIRVAPELVRHVSSLASSAGLAARRARTAEDRRLTDAAVALAERRMAAWVAPPDPKRPHFPPRVTFKDRHGHRLARFGLGALQLHLATGKDEHLRLAISCANRVLALQKRLIPPGALLPLGGDIFSWSLAHEDMDLPELFLAELLLALPDHPDAPRWRASLRLVADWWMKPTRELWGPFSLPNRLVGAKQLTDETACVQASVTQGKSGARWLVPSAGRQQLADTALAMQRIAQALEDPELERLARRQVHWAFGYNPFDLSWVALHDERSIEQMYSFSQGRMAGAVAGYGIGPDGVPGNVRPSGAEPVTHAAAELLAAAIALTEPARWTLHFEEEGRPWQGEVTVAWDRNGRVVARDRTDSEGRLPELALDGGERYTLRAGATRVPLPALSGTRGERTIDLGRQLVLGLSPAEQARQNRPFTVALEARNTGTRPLVTTLRLEAAGLFARQRAAPLALEPGESVTIDWPLQAKTAGTPWAILVTADGTAAVAELGGTTMKPEPPPAAR
jgi:hypothetical protein